MNVNSAQTWQFVAQGTVDLIKGISSYQSSDYTQSMLALKAGNALANRNTARLNALVANRDMINNQRMIEQQAAIQGVANAQKIAATQVQGAASGVLLNSASKFEVEASEKFNAAVDYNNLELQRVYQKTSDDTKVGNYLGEAFISQGEYEANTILSDSTNPMLSGLIGSLTSSLGSIGNPNSYWASFGSPSVGNNGFFGSLNMGTGN